MLINEWVPGHISIDLTTTLSVTWTGIAIGSASAAGNTTKEPMNWAPLICIHHNNKEHVITLIIQTTTRPLASAMIENIIKRCQGLGYTHPFRALGRRSQWAMTGPPGLIHGQANTTMSTSGPDRTSSALSIHLMRMKNLTSSTKMAEANVIEVESVAVAHSHPLRNREKEVGTMLMGRMTSSKVLQVAFSIPEGGCRRIGGRRGTTEIATLVGPLIDRTRSRKISNSSQNLDSGFMLPFQSMIIICPLLISYCRSVVKSATYHITYMLLSMILSLTLYLAISGVFSCRKLHQMI